MLFNSLTFVVFFCVVLGLHALLPHWNARKLLLLVASYLFYAAWNPPYVLILAFSTALDWWLARLIWRSEGTRRRRALLVASLVGNLSLLGFFKYGGFLLNTLQAVLGTAGINYQPPAWNIVLPVGISFYTFASLSYTIDVYRRRMRGDCSLLDYALFVSFFPHLVAGPIVRAHVLIPQIQRPRQRSGDQLGWGLCLLCIGLFQKAVLADTVFAPVVDAVYANPESVGAVEGWAAVLGFSGQIYYDFAGYSLAAIGLALCFGFEFPDNFRHPYAARGFSDFWSRWHISLSSWFRDYFYIPLGGNRGGARSTSRNLMLTMLVAGLWHGASWMYVLWGALHGLYLLLERLYHRWRGSLATRGHGNGIGIALLTFLVVSLTWIPFRAESPAEAWSVLETLWRLWPSESVSLSQLMASYSVIGFTFAWHLRLRDGSLEREFGAWQASAQAGAVAACLAALFLFSGGDQRAFIYFQF